MKKMSRRKSALMVPVFLAALLGAGAGYAAEEKIPWHVRDADVRIPVTVSIEETLKRMPPDVYLADMTPTGTKGLAFDRRTKSAVMHDIRTPEQRENIIAEQKKQCAASGQEYKPEMYQPDLRAEGSATFALKPEYKWFSFGFRGEIQVFIDGTNIFQKNDWGNDLNDVIVIPSNAKELRVEAKLSGLRRAGFITRNPPVANATLCLSGLDPTELIPLVYDLRGRQVGCRILWVHPGEPMTILFDSSSGEKCYMVYLVPRLKQPPRLDWTPKAGIILECRYPDRYDPAISTLEGFRKLWDGASFIAGKEAVTRYLTGGSQGHGMDPRWRPATVIAHDFLPFRLPPPVDEARNFRDARGLRRQSLALTRYTGFFHVPETREYEFKFNAEPAGYLLMDDQVISEWRVGEKPQTDQWRKAFKLNLEKGIHKLEFCQYGRREGFLNWFCWALPDNERLIRTFGGYEFNAWEPLVEAVAGAMNRRDDKPFASFTWSYVGKEWLGRNPAGDFVQYSLAGALSPERTGTVFRWRFDDGHTAETQTVDHVFFSPGTRKVELEVLDGPGGKVIAHTEGNIHLHADWSNPTDYTDIKELDELIARRESEFASGTPVRDLLSLYEWSLQCEWPGEWPNRRRAIAAALAGRIDEVIGKTPYPRLLDLAQSVPMAAHFPAVEKLCNAVMDRAPVGTRHWKSAAMALADNLISVCGEPGKALQLLEKAEKSKPDLDLTGGWCIAAADRWYPSIPDSGQLAGLIKGLNWSKPSNLPINLDTKNGIGLWFSKDLQVPDSRRGKELMLEFTASAPPGQILVWFNDKLFSDPVWLGGSIVIPADAQRYGETNHFLARFQTMEPPEWRNLKNDHIDRYGFWPLGPDKDDLTPRIRAEALLAMGEEAKATGILLQLKQDVPWPLDEQTQLKLAGDLRRIQRLAKEGGTSAESAIAILDDWMGKYPMIRTVQDVQIAKAEAFAGMGDAPRAMTLSGRLLRAGISETQREQLMLLQVKVMCKAGRMDAAREMYIKLKKFAPYSPATVEAREAITKTVLGKGR